MHAKSDQLVYSTDIICLYTSDFLKIFCFTCFYFLEAFNSRKLIPVIPDGDTALRFKQFSSFAESRIYKIFKRVGKRECLIQKILPNIIVTIFLTPLIRFVAIKKLLIVAAMHKHFFHLMFNTKKN